MAKRTKKSGLSVKSFKDHARDETEYGMEFIDLPGGITGGIARLVDAKLGVYAKGNNAGENFGEERLTEAIRRNGGMNSAAFVNLVGGTVDAFLGGGEQNDDITISTLKRLK